VNNIHPRLQLWRGLFQSAFILQVFTYHLSAIQGGIQVPGIADVDPAAALALSAVAVSRLSISLWMDK
jgi:hypothetical protein